ncbi:phage portal protein [Plesiomonas shigelloides]|uniref:phage portal protein n=1 Tax=Plesiomonas shigelloides TaxID=703 RepID=UPI0012623286|nr:phage portal protein [Plesiomonas shigelloides]KAB7715718.1 phage portal protein [Plesiomonas shigelloides]
MSKKQRRAYKTAESQSKKAASFIEFSDPEPVSAWGSYNGVLWSGYDGYYLPPIERKDLAVLANIATYHGSVIRARVNMVMAGFQGGGGLSYSDMSAAVMNLLIFGDVGLLKVRNRLRRVNRLHVLPSLYLRRKMDMSTVITQVGQENKSYAVNEVIFIAQYDAQQQVYGVPDYIHGMESAMLNVDATRFRRRYYKNGAHLGYILYSTDPDMSPELEAEFRKKIEASKGAGNFKSMFINIPGGDKEGVKVIPIGDSGTKDEFSNIKNVSAQDQLTAHRFPPGLAGIIPSNAGGLGDPLKSREAYYRDEVIPLRRLIMDGINSDPEIGHVGAVKFDLTFDEVA